MRVIHVQTGRLGFKAKLLIALLLALSVALMTVLAVAVLFIVPVLMIAGMVYAVLPGKRQSRSPPRDDGPEIVEGRYRVIDRPDRD